MTLRADLGSSGSVMTIPLLPADLALEADTVAALLADGELVVELRDGHKNLLARSVADTTRTREDTVDALLAKGGLQRASDFIVDPLKRNRTIADVVPGVTKTMTGFEAARAAAPMTA